MVAAAISGLAGAWIAAGATGLLAHSLRHALVWLTMAVAVAGCWPEKRTWTGILAAILAVAAGVVMTAWPLAAVNVLAIAVLLAGLAAGRSGADRKAVLVVSQAIAIFGLYRIAVTSIVNLWVLADTVGGWLGRVAGAITGRPLSVGASFAGVDFLVLMAAFFGLWLAATPRPRFGRAVAAVAGILSGHLVYLMVLAFAGWMVASIPTPAAPTGLAVYSPDKPWSFWAAVKTLVPWDLPALAGLMQIVVASIMLRWAPPVVEAAEGARPRRTVAAVGLALAAGLAAVVLPIATVLYTTPADLSDKKIVAYEKGFLNWLKPAHDEYGRLTIGMYGLLSDLVESLGGTLVRSPDLSEKDLEGASALFVIYPNKPWEPWHLERVWNFVRRGGSLLVMGEHTVRESDGGARFNDLLAPTNMRVQFDCAQWAVGGWLDCYEAMAHPITARHGDDRNEFGVVIGASVDARWPARPLILGRWGWSDWGDPGSSRAMMGNDRYDAGERLGDIGLAAEQSLGDGKIIVFGDTSSLTNGINISTYGFTSALLSYLAGPSSAPALGWQVLGALAALVAAMLLVRRPAAWRVAAVALAAAASLSVCAAVTHSASRILPDGHRREPNNLAYIDTSHLEAFSQEGLRDDGIMGLELTLMRSGFVTLSLGDFSAEALRRAAVLVSIAPQREFSRSEREAVREFVENGGVFISTVGYDDSQAAAPLLKEFGLRVGEPGNPDQEPRPLGHFKSPYLNIEGRMRFVRFHAGWTVAQDDSGAAEGRPPARPIAYGRDELPVILLRPWGKGKVVLVGDTCFAMNKNLEHMDGSPFEGMRENADFWRWLLACLTDRPAWIPPAPEPPPAPKPAPSAGKVTP